jgi:integrase
LTIVDAARIMREALKNKAYRQYPLGQEAGRYLRAKRKRLTKDSYRDYESCLDKLARHFTDLEIGDFEPPIGTERLEEFLDHQWGHREPRTYNKNHSILSDFFRFQVLRGELHGDPMLRIDKAKGRDVYRTVFTPSTRTAIFAANPTQPDITALRLLLTYALRKGALQTVRFEHFDFHRRQLTIFTKGETVRRIPIPDPSFWSELDLYMLATAPRSTDYLLCRQKTIPRRFENGKAVEYQVRRWPEQPMGGHGLHSWWYRCLHRAGVVPGSVEAGERMHKARHTAGQRVLDNTGGNLKAVQALLGHADISTTGNVYTDWDIDQLAQTLSEIQEDS